jgi:hypothetical protein
MVMRRVPNRGPNGVSKERKDQDDETTNLKDHKKLANCLIPLALLRKHFIGPSRIGARVMLAVFTVLLLVCINEGIRLGTDQLATGEDTRHLRPFPPKVRVHTFSYLDTTTNKQVTRTIQMAAPHLQQRHRRFNYYEQDEPRVNFNDPDNGMAFTIDDADDRQCFPMGSWQTSNYQTCNKFHELETASHDTMLMTYINCGENRCTFLIQDTAGSNNVVYKTLILREGSETKFGGARKYEMAIKDSLALERLSSSPYVVDLYASCAVTQIVEHSSGGNIHDLLKRSRAQKRVAAEVTKHPKHHHKHEQEDGPSGQRVQFISPLSKLKIAFHVATAVADMHSLETHPDGLPSMVHNDLCCHQFILVDGIYKLGDFDLTTFLTQTTPAGGSTTLRRKHKPDLCQTTPIQFHPDYLKCLAPEEYPYYHDFRNALKAKGNKEPHPITRVYRDKLDVYQIGTILYTLTTNLWIWEGITTASAMLKRAHVRFTRAFSVMHLFLMQSHTYFLFFANISLLIYTGRTCSIPRGTRQ